MPERPATISAVEDTYRALQDAQQQAAARAPDRVHVSSYTIAGHPATIRLIGNSLGHTLTRAFSHLRSADSPAQPALSIEGWDEAETGVPAPLARAVLAEESPGITTASEDGRYVVFERAGSMFAFDRVRRHIVGWVADTGRLTQYEIGRPWHSELLLWGRDRGLQPVHAGFIHRNGDGILLGGPGGSGKSTTSLLCMGAGWDYLADDYVALESRGEGFVGHGLYCSTHLEPEHLRRFAHLEPSAIPGRLAREDKSLVLLSGVAGSRLSARANIRVLALPHVADQATTTFRRASRAEALLRLAPSSLLLLPYQGAGHNGFAALVALVERVPTYWLELGRDFAQLPVAVGDMLADASSR